MPFSAFRDDQELLEFAERFLNERIKSLVADTAHCLAGGGGIFPALLYALATIDLLGALLAGKATKKGAQTSSQARAYMERFMHYSPDEAKLIQDLFRHKLVHLAQPKPVVRDNGRTISWQLWRDDQQRHRQLEATPGNAPVTSQLTVIWTHRLSLSIRHFEEEIKSSVQDTAEYLDSLRADPALQILFDNAIAELHGRNP